MNLVSDSLANARRNSKPDETLGHPWTRCRETRPHFNPTMQPPNLRILGFVLLAFGVALGALAGLRPDLAKAPVVAVWGIAAAAVCGGLALALHSARTHRLFWSLLSAGLVSATLAGAWYALGPGSRLCTRGRFSQWVLSEAECRYGAGIATLWLLVLCLVAVRQARRTRHPS